MKRGLGRFAILHHQRPKENENEEKHVKLVRTEERPPQDSNTVPTEKWSVASTLVARFSHANCETTAYSLFTVVH